MLNPRNHPTKQPQEASSSESAVPPATRSAIALYLALIVGSIVYNDGMHMQPGAVLDWALRLAALLR